MKSKKKKKKKICDAGKRSKQIDRCSSTFMYILWREEEGILVSFFELFDVLHFELQQISTRNRKSAEFIFFYSGMNLSRGLREPRASLLLLGRCSPSDEVVNFLPSIL